MICLYINLINHKFEEQELDNRKKQLAISFYISIIEYRGFFGGEFMGTYLNPGNSGFKRILKDYYVDKTEMIELINNRIDTADNLICISRPRRFGKSYAAQMLCAYYDHTCDSDDLFKNYKIGATKDYKKHLKNYNVIYLDIAGIISKMNTNGISIRNIANRIKELINQEIRLSFPTLPKYDDASDAILACVADTKKMVVFIIDEWDAVIREAKNDRETQKSYLDLLREWFKNGNFTSKAVAASYMTGILPIKKDGSESAISDFDEYSVIDPGEFAPYTGFTENEVKVLCEHYSMDFQKAKEWYDGYSFGECHSIYNPYSVMQAMKRKSFKSYWRKTSKAESLITYVNMNVDGLQEKVFRLIAGEPIEVYTDDFENDFETFNSSDDVLTLMIHLGYLVYDEATSQVRIPNEELRNEFRRLLKKPNNNRLGEFIRTSEQLLKDTLAGNEAAVVSTIEKVRETNYAPQYYNNEQSLRYVIKFAYIICIDRYLKVEELPTGRGIADVVFLPNRDTALPAMIVELKWEKTAETAIEQIKNRNYPAILNGYCGEVVLVGINYDDRTKEHTCRIEKINI